jgi:hypothetical protein
VGLHADPRCAQESSAPCRALNDCTYPPDAGNLASAGMPHLPSPARIEIAGIIRERRALDVQLHTRRPRLMWSRQRLAGNADRAAEPRGGGKSSRGFEEHAARVRHEVSAIATNRSLPPWIDQHQIILEALGLCPQHRAAVP